MKLFSTLRSLPFPWVYVLELLLTPALFAAFYVTVVFFASDPADALREKGVAIPAAWEAAMSNHGAYVRGFSASAHPVLLLLSMFVLIVLNIAILQLRRAQEAQRGADGADRRTAHAIARAITFVIWAVRGFLMVMWVLPQLSVA